MRSYLAGEQQVLANGANIVYSKINAVRLNICITADRLLIENCVNDFFSRNQLPIPIASGQSLQSDHVFVVENHNVDFCTPRYLDN